MAPVSIERLIAEVEPGVVTDQLLRDGIVVSGLDADLAEAKKRALPLQQVQALALSFRSLATINNLAGLQQLGKLQLNNNRITRIENLGHLTNLTWLDLSFNHITAIEGLDSLRLQDLSLFNNQVSSLQGLDALQHSLNVLSIGNNCLADLRSTACLTRCSNLQLLNLAGNPLCADTDYRAFVLSHLQTLVYLDYRRVQAPERVAAIEAHQDEVLELHEAQEAAAAEAAAAAANAAHAAAMAAANLDGIETLLEDAIAGDADWRRLAGVPGMLEPWGDVRDKWQVATDEFKALILATHERKEAEQAQFQAALSGVLAERDAEGRALIAAYDKLHKHLLRSTNPAPAEEQVLSTKVKLMVLQEALLELQLGSFEVARALTTEFDRAYVELAEANKLQYNAYFTQVRDLLNAFFLGLAAAAPGLAERYGAAAESPELDALPEEVQLLLGDKDALLGAVQSSHELHIGQLDALEDRLVGAEVGGANALADRLATQQAAHHGERMAEILAYLERQTNDLDALAADAEEDAAADLEAAAADLEAAASCGSGGYGGGGQRLPGSGSSGGLGSSS